MLITVAGGSIGSALVESLAGSDSCALILLDSSENNLFPIENELDKADCSRAHVPILGSMWDKHLLCDLFERYRPEIAYHWAAYKHVPLMEANPFAVTRNDALGTHLLAKVTLRCGACDLMLISTDKAVNPRSLLGVSKRIAELVVLVLGNSCTRMKAVHLGDVLGSEGSVVPPFLQQIASGEPVTVAHPEACRYFLTVAETARYICAASSINCKEQIFVPEVGEAMKILDLAYFLIEHARAADSFEATISYSGLRPGDKLSGELTGGDEKLEPTDVAGLYAVKGPAIAREQLLGRLAELDEVVERRDLQELLHLVGRIFTRVPAEPASAADGSRVHRAMSLQ